MKKTFLFFALCLLLAACEPLEVDTPLPITQIPFYATETPSIIIPVTETPQIILPVTDTPQIAQPVTETPVIVQPATTDTAVPVPAVKWWQVYFTDPLTINDPNNPAGSIEEKLIQFINNAQISIHIA